MKMEEINYRHVEASIGHTFKNRDLLRQAFTRRSYTQECGGENNEVLEFIGDKALDLAVLQLLIREFGEMEDGSSAAPVKSKMIEFSLNPEKPGAFVCSVDEGELTEIKSRMVSKHYLARRMDDLGFAQYIIMGVGDKKNGVDSEASVKEDLFEAILGAVTLDCGWDLSEIVSVAEAMLCIDDFFLSDSDDNYVRLIHEWEEQVNHALPLFWFREARPGNTAWYRYDVVDMGHGVIFQDPPSYYDSVNFYCDLKLADVFPVFRGWGASKSDARMNACKLGYEYLIKEGYIGEYSIRDEIGEPTEDFSINQLEILARRDYFPLPKFDYSQEYDKDGNPIWQCRCSIDGFPPQSGKRNSSKKGAKKSAAMKMLLYVLDNYDDRQNEEAVQ
jgi:ribonuclease-3